MDLRITIRDENDNTLRELTVYQDGSDSEGADTIEDFIRDNFTVEETVLPHFQYVIRMDTYDDKILYWNNTQGWVDRDSATQFSQEERETLNLPMGGMWERD
jgi:hypothetical protein